VFTARYALSPYIKQIRFFFKGLSISCIERNMLCYLFDCTCTAGWVLWNPWQISASTFRWLIPIIWQIFIARRQGSKAWPFDYANFLTIRPPRLPDNALCYTSVEQRGTNVCVFLADVFCTVLMDAGCFSFLVILFSSLWMDSALFHCFV
jgi:hypothetical protein